MRAKLCFGLTIFLLLVTSISTQAQVNDEKRIIVQLKKGERSTAFQHSLYVDALSLISSKTPFADTFREIGGVRLERLFKSLITQPGSGRIPFSFGEDFWVVIYSSSLEESYVISMLKSRGAVLAAAVDTKAYKCTVTPDDPHYSGNWGFNDDDMDLDVSAPEAWNIYDAYGSPSRLVCTIDIGIRAVHEDFGGVKILPAYRTYNGQMEDPVVEDDPDGHGTPIAATIAALTANGLGAAGLLGGNGAENIGTKILPVKANVPGYWYIWTSHMADGIIYAINHNPKPDVINISYSAHSDSLALDLAIAEAYNQGVPIVAAVGHGWEGSPPSTPGNKEDLVITVAGMDETGQRGTYDYGRRSKRSNVLDVAGPDFVFTASNKPHYIYPELGYYNPYYGTSIAAGFISGDGDDKTKGSRGFTDKSHGSSPGCWCHLSGVER